MSTDKPINATPQNTTTNTPSSTANVIPNLVNVLKSVDTTTPEATQNATSMNDGKGGRITYNEYAPKTDVHDH